jgi:hypothetical protein
MQKQLDDKVSRLLEEAEQSARQGRREMAYQTSLDATGLAPGEPLAWYLRAQTAPSQEEQLMCLSRAYSLDTTRPEARQELRAAVQDLLKQEPFLAYVFETPELYQVRSRRDMLINIPKSRAFETPYLERDPGPARPAYRWLNISLLGLLLGGVGAVLLAPITIFQVLRLQATPLYRSDRIRLWVILMIAVFIWLIAIPVSWLLLIRLFPS